ncbi:elongation factor 4 [Candidatus Gottesmanbacteria bacterium]|nr:elongation factor 4 [Candidatus Gottesmanbacteria bacterium]
MHQDHIRNFAIIAHIDHGKSTLADRLLEMTGTVAMRDMRSQILDSNPIERERGITIKLAPVRMVYRCEQIRNPKSEIRNNIKIQNSNVQNNFEFRASNFEFSSSEYILNLIDTPGHVDFGYEVSRSLAACEGALLVVDATQGVQAQTLANLSSARAHNLTIIPLINKIDMPHARIGETRAELVTLGFTEEEMIEISAKTGQNVDHVLDAIITRIPPPTGKPDQPLRALIFSSQFDPHKGVVVFVRIVDGDIGAVYGSSFAAHPSVPSASYLKQSKEEMTVLEKTRRTAPMTLRFMASGAEVTPIEIGYFNPQMAPCDTLRCGEVGYIATGLKDIRLAKVGDTISISSVIPGLTRNPSLSSTGSRLLSLRRGRLGRDDKEISPLPGYKEPKPMVFLSLFPINSDELHAARESLEKLRLSDSAFSFRPIASAALGNGFHCGFLGLLHAEIVQERLSREFDLNMIATAPSVEYHLMLSPGVALSKLGLTASSVIGTSNEAGTEVVIQSASEFPDPTYIAGVKEPIMEVKIFTPKAYVGPIMQLSQEKRGVYVDLTYHIDTSSWSEAIGSHGDAIVPQKSPAGLQHEARDAGHACLTYLMPLADMIIDFFDRLKSISEGYASLDYEFYEFQAVDVVKIDILVNHEKVDALSFLAVRDQAHHRSIAIVDRLAEVIPRQQFTIPIQGAIGGQIVARADVKSFRKDVIQKLYGGDRTRKDKLLKKQAKGKARMKLIGRVEIPQSAFFEVLKRE